MERSHVARWSSQQSKAQRTWDPRRHFELPATAAIHASFSPPSKPFLSTITETLNGSRGACVSFNNLWPERHSDGKGGGDVSEIFSEYTINLIDKDCASYTLQLWFFLGQAPEPVRNISESFCGIRMSMICYYWNKNLGLQCQETGD